MGTPRYNFVFRRSSHSAGEPGLLFVSASPQAQQPPPQFPNMTFFVTSVGVRRAPTSAASRAPTSIARPWPRRPAPAARPGAPISAPRPSAAPRRSMPRDRIGKGPWVNAKGVQIAASVADLHSANNKIAPETASTENGRRRQRPRHTPQQARHPDRLAGRRHRLPARQGHDLRQLDQVGRRPAPCSAMPTAWACATTMPRSRGTPRTRRAPATRPRWSRPAAPACSTASRRTDLSQRHGAWLAALLMTLFLHRSAAAETIPFPQRHLAADTAATAARQGRRRDHRRAGQRRACRRALSPAR